MAHYIYGTGVIESAIFDAYQGKPIVRASVRCNDGPESIAGKGGTVTLWLDSERPQWAKEGDPTPREEAVNVMRAAGFLYFGLRGRTQAEMLSRPKGFPVTIAFAPGADGKLWPKRLYVPKTLKAEAPPSEDAIAALFSGDDGGNDIPF